ncbi:MAG: type IV pilus twitching motility protein PilT [Patescibacteria group bacterium]|nr:type IV pilus twitching motility protein PilT [Patescibacteria group bacterium]
MNIKELLRKAVEEKASDLHLVVGLPPILRLDGELVPIKKENVLLQKEVEQMAFSLLSETQKEKFVRKKDLDLGFSLDDKSRFRINLRYERGNVSLAARVINERLASLEEIGMPKIITSLLDLDQGLVLVTGPTGCGKSVTLAAMINYINKNRRCNIITLEDPIEFIFKSEKSVITQRQLGSDMLSFSSGLKHILRQDPDVVMVGEMRDLETIGTTITLAETGHLVLATLHTYSAAQTVDRIIDIFPPHQQNQVRMQLSMVLAAVISQRLLPRIAGGRVAAREIMFNTPAVANLIRENKIAQLRTVIETSSKEGMISLDQHLKKLYEEKIISKEVAQAQMNNPEMLDKFKIL